MSLPVRAADFTRDGNRVICGDARFDILSPTLIRMQYSTAGFVDEPTVVVTNRSLKCSDFSASSKSGWLTIKTKRVELLYQVDSGSFTSDNLRAIWYGETGLHQWAPGVADDKNLGGPPASFNSIYEDTAGDKTLPNFPDGFLSRNGFCLLDDSSTPVWNEQSQWIAPRQKSGAKDWYLFVYGDDYKGFFRDYTQLAGKIPMVPRWVLGACMTDLNFEHSNQGDQEGRLSSYIDRFRKERIPLDTLVFDYGWHKGAWAAMDWSPAVPDAPAFLKKLRAEGIKVAVNDHPATLPSSDSHTASASKKLGIPLTDIRTTGSTTPGIQFNLADQKQAEVWMSFHDELFDQGVSFFWIDGDDASMDGLNSQMWTNRLYYENQEKHSGERSFILSRYGGPGNHRYPGYFTGDCHANWKVLSYEIPYVVKSGNVLLPYVSNDISGFVEPLSDNFELYARWVEFGALSPMLRLHSTVENPNQGNARLPWNYGRKGIDLARKFFQLRYRLLPYLYTCSREAYDTGMPLCRALYLEYPRDNEAYNHFDEYLLGEDLLVAPITAPAIDGNAARSIYFPSGNWIDYFTGKAYKGGRSATYTCPLERMPLFVREGSIIPMQPDMAYTTQKPVDPLILDIYPSTSAAFNLYEDDGSTLSYKNGKFARTSIRATQSRSGVCRVDIDPSNGSFDNQLPARAYRIDLHLKQKPQSVVIDGAPASYNWDPTSKVATIRIGRRSVRRSTSVIVK
jgi:alpha-glucosidase (family GH31 glycosyl hydrolase)